MGDLSLTQMALELLQINENFCCYTENLVSDFELYTFCKYGVVQIVDGVVLEDGL